MAGDRAAAVRADRGVGGCRPLNAPPIPGRCPKPCMAAARLPGGGGGYQRADARDGGRACGG